MGRGGEFLAVTCLVSKEPGLGSRQWLSSDIVCKMLVCGVQLWSLSSDLLSFHRN